MRVGPVGAAIARFGDLAGEAVVAVHRFAKAIREALRRDPPAPEGTEPKFKVASSEDGYFVFLYSRRGRVWAWRKVPKSYRTKKAAALAGADLVTAERLNE